MKNYGKVVPVMAVALGLAASVAITDQQADAADGLFGMTEVSGNGLLLAEGDHKCGAGQCGKDDSDHCGKDGDDHCGKDKGHQNHDDEDDDHGESHKNPA